MGFLVLLAILILPFNVILSINVTINTNPVRTVPEKFLSVSLDSLSAFPDTWNYLNFSFMAPLAKALAPAYFRFGGTYSDLMVFNETNNGPALQVIPGCLPNSKYGNYCTILTANQFDTIYKFSKDAGLRFIFDLNSMLRNGTNLTPDTIHLTGWNSTNAQKLLNYASVRNFDMDWELGNEPDGFVGLFKNLTLTGEQIAQNFKQLRSLMDANSLYKNSILIGPSTCCTPDWVIPDFVQNNGGNYVNAMTAHHYYFAGATAKVEDFLNPTNMDKYIYYINGYKNNSNNYKPIWNGETSSAYNGGAANMSDKFVAGFLWLDKLGLSALLGIDVVIRQALVGAGGAYAFGNYNLLNQEMKPNTDYWLSFLYKKIVGSTVFNVTIDQPDRNLRLYAASSKNNNNALVLYGQYSGNNSFTIDVPQLTYKQVTLYLFKEGEPGNLQSNLSRINGQLINWDTHKPMANIQGAQADLPITLPSYSLFFIVAQTTMIQNCPDGWYKEKTVSNKCLKIVDAITQPWFSANLECTTYGFQSSLLSIDGAFENAEITQYIQSDNTICSQFYLGLYRNNTSWAWSDGDARTYRNWKNGFPTNDNTQNCATFDKASGTWANNDCDASQGYICQLFY